MFSAAYRLLILYFVAWLIATQWVEGSVLFDDGLSKVLSYLPARTPIDVFVGFLVISLAWHMMGLLLWLSPVSLDSKLGPTRHPFPRRPLRLQLRLKSGRTVGLFLLVMVGFLFMLQSLQALVPARALDLPLWLGALRPLRGGTETALVYLAIHAIGAGIGWMFVVGIARVFAAKAGRDDGFIWYHVEHKPVARRLVRIVVFAHFPLASIAATSHPHPQFPLLVLASLTAVVCISTLAQILTLAIERRHDQWLFALESRCHARDGDGSAVSLRQRALQFLHSDRDEFPLPLASPTTSHTSAWPERAPTVAETHPVEPTQARDRDPGHQAAKALALAQAHIIRGEYRRARARLEDAMVSGNAAERQRAQALRQGLPGQRRRVLVAAGALGLCMVSLGAFVAWQWWLLPDGEGTRQLARSAHVHVKRTTHDDGPRIALLGTRYDYSLNTGLQNISTDFVNAVIASEDHRFFEHGLSYKLIKFAQAGVKCIARKLNIFSTRSGCSGNSTIPQQLARNLFLSESRSIQRKLKELLWAIKMERDLSKEEILEHYLNRIYLGRGNFGVEMAARSYFQTSASSLSRFDAILLAAAVKRPGWNWQENRIEAMRRARLILAQMVRYGYAEPGERFPTDYQPTPGERQLRKPYLGHLWQWIRRDVEQTLDELPDGSYKVVTTLNAEVEIYAERHLGDEVARLNRAGVPVSQGAVVVMRPDGRVLAMVGGIGSDLKGRGLNRAKRTRGLHLRPPASAFKPFLYLAALETGLNPNSKIDARPVEIDVAGVAEPYRPQNHDGLRYADVSLREGLVKSINTAAVNLLHDRVGFEHLFDTMTRLGVDAREIPRQWGLALGQTGISLIEMTAAYAAFANGGNSVRPYALVAVTTEDGKTVWRRREAQTKRDFTPRAVSDLNSMLRDVVRTGTGYRAQNQLPKDSVVAGKTGTGDGFVDAWFLGYTADIVIGVWMGNDQPVAMPGVYGGTAPARTFNKILRDLLNYTELVSVNKPLP